MARRFRYGKYKGQTAAEIRRKDPSYLVWAKKTIRDSGITDAEYDSALAGDSFNKALRRVTPSMGFLKDRR